MHFLQETCTLPTRVRPRLHQQETKVKIPIIHRWCEWSDSKWGRTITLSIPLSGTYRQTAASMAFWNSLCTPSRLALFKFNAIKLSFGYHFFINDGLTSLEVLREPLSQTWKSLLCLKGGWCWVGGSFRLERFLNKTFPIRHIPLRRILLWSSVSNTNSQVGFSCHAFGKGVDGILMPAC